jgi:hypothetical protein
MFRIVMKRSNRRASARRPASDPVLLIIPGEMEVEAPATLLNFSHRGLAVSTSYPIKIGTTLVIQCGILFFVGTIRRSLVVGEFFQLGLQLDPTSDNDRAIEQLATLYPSA